MLPQRKRQISAPLTHSSSHALKSDSFRDSPEEFLVSWSCGADIAENQTEFTGAS